MKRILFILCLASALTAQDRVPQPSPQRMEIILEQQQGTAWTRVDPGTIFEKGDRVRFRFRANFDAYLYVMDSGTSGSYSLLFPHKETGSDNKVVSGREYFIPATQAWFKIDGPPGHDVVYWLASPIPLSGDSFALAPPQPEQKPKTLLPRCDDSILRARGDCVDSSAGLRSIPETEDVPGNLKHVPRLQSRELVIMRKDDSSLVSSPVPLTEPVLYQFRLAHK